MRNNRSNLFLVLLLIAIFSLQSFSTSESTHIVQTNNSSSNQTTPSNLNGQKVLSQNQLNTATTVSTNLRNLSVSDLYNYLKFSSSQASNAFIDSKNDYMDTTITAARGLAILKILGFTNYLISDVNKSGIFTNFKLQNGGYLLYSSSSSPSIAGTYGAVESGYLLNLVASMSGIKAGAITFLNSKYHNTTTIGGFKEDFQTNITASIQSTYYAVQALKILGYSFSYSQQTQIYNFLVSLWNDAGHYFKNTYDPDQSPILNSFQAITIIHDLGLTGSQLWSNITSGFPQFVNSLQEKSGLLIGGIHSPNTYATVDDTGSALSSLYMLNKLNSINVSSAIQFIIQSQYNGKTFPDSIGGFSYNNSTQSSQSQFSGVTLTHTYYAILGLYASGYLTNQTKLSFQTDYSVANHLNNLKDEILVGQNSTFTAQVSVLNYKNYYDKLGVSFQIQGINSLYNTTTDTTNGSLYSFFINFNKSTDFSIGPHSLTAYYSLSNFSIIPVITEVYHSQMIVRLPITSSINGLSSSVTVSPGDLVKGQIIFDNNTVQASHISYTRLGNVSVSLVYPNGTSQQLNSSYTFALSMTTSDYNYNFTLPKNAVLGDYMVNITYTNTSVLFYTEQVFTVSTSVYLLAVTSSNNNNLVPDSNFDLGFKIAYQNGLINPDISNITAKFYSTTTKQNLFSANLVYNSGNNFVVSNTVKVPIGMFMGSYNISIALQWNSSTTGNSLPMNIQNSTLSLVTYQGLPIIENYQISPLTGQRNKTTTIYSGDFLNLTANIGVKFQNSPIFLLKNQSLDLSASLINSTNNNQILQDLSVSNLNNSQISVYGEINPNINILSSVSLTLSLKIKYTSTNVYNLIYYLDSANKTIAYRPLFTLEKANLKLEQKSVDFSVGSSVIAKNEYTTLLVSFKVISVQNNQYVTGLNLNASLLASNNGKANGTTIPLPAVTTLETNNSYQLQIPVNNLDIGHYFVEISPLNTNVSLGTFSLQINPVSSNGGIPIQNFISVGTVTVAIILSIVAYQTKKKK